MYVCMPDFIRPYIFQKLFCFLFPCFWMGIIKRRDEATAFTRKPIGNKLYYVVLLSVRVTAN